MLTGLERCHYRVAGSLEMPCRMFVDRGVTASYVTATQTEPQMHPLIIVLYAFLAAVLAAGLLNVSFRSVITRQKMLGFVTLRRFWRMGRRIAGLDPNPHCQH